MLDAPVVDRKAGGIGGNRVNGMAGGESTGREAYAVAGSATWDSQHHVADNPHRFIMPDHVSANGPHVVSSAAWSGESASSDGGFGYLERPHETRLRESVTQQLRVSAVHWSVSQVQMCHAVATVPCLTVVGINGHWPSESVHGLLMRRGKSCGYVPND
jgi:hypothetical protein